MGADGRPATERTVETLVAIRFEHPATETGQEVADRRTPSPVRAPDDRMGADVADRHASRGFGRPATE
jgi:hypothetical protein